MQASDCSAVTLELLQARAFKVPNLAKRAKVTTDLDHHSSDRAVSYPNRFVRRSRDDLLVIELQAQDRVCVASERGIKRIGQENERPSLVVDCSSYLSVFWQTPLSSDQILSVLSYDPLMRMVSLTCKHRTVSVCPSRVILQVTLDHVGWSDRSQTLIEWSADPL